MPGAGVLRNSVARHRHHGRVRRCRITGALLGPRCKPRRRSGPALPSLTRFARRCRQPKLSGSASAVVVLIVAATLTDIAASGTALALRPLGAGKGGFQLCCRRHTQLAALQAGPHPPMTPAQPHRLDAPLRGGVGEAQLAHRVVEQAREPAPQRQTAADGKKVRQPLRPVFTGLPTDFPARAAYRAQSRWHLLSGWTGWTD